MQCIQNRLSLFTKRKLAPFSRCLLAAFESLRKKKWKWERKGRRRLKTREREKDKEGKNEENHETEKKVGQNEKVYKKGGRPKKRHKAKERGKGAKKQKKKIKRKKKLPWSNTHQFKYIKYSKRCINKACICRLPPSYKNMTSIDLTWRQSMYVLSKPIAYTWMTHMSTTDTRDLHQTNT